MEHNIIELLNNKMTSNLNLNDIARRLGVKTEEIEDTIRFLEENGTIFLDKSGRYSLVSKSSLKKGIIKITSRKGAIVVLEGGKDLDLILNSHSKVRHNDIVLVEPYYKGGTAQLVKVLKREYKDYVGTVIKEEGIYKLEFSDGKYITLKEKYPLGTRILLDGKTNQIKKVIGHKDDPDIRIKELLLVNGFSVNFSDDYMDELKNEIMNELSEEIILEEKKKGRLDLRKIDIVTIDGDDTKDFDDAVGFVNNTLYVAIADTEYTIKEDSTIDKDTIKRGISVYPPGMVNPMIHHKISNGICSLVPGEDRFTVSSITRFDEHGERVSFKAPMTIINSKKRMTYEDVNKYLEEGIILPGYENYTEMLNKLYNFAMKQKNKMLNEGFLEFSSSEIKVIFENERIIGIKQRHHGKAEQLIEFLMLYHNLEMTSEFIKRGIPFIARNHGEPNQDKLIAWCKLLSQRGYRVDIKKKYTNEDIKELLKIYSDGKEKIVLDNIGIRAQSKANYGAYNKGHFALGVKAYATFTSPIRRLSDYINQRIYADALKYGNEFTRDKWEPRMEALAKIATDSEIRADKVEMTAVKIKTAEYMANVPVGTIYNGFIASISSGSIKVLLPNGIYGTVLYSNKDYSIGKDGFSLIHNTTGERFLVGDSMNVSFKNIKSETGDIISSRVGDYKNEKEKGKSKIRVR